MVQSKSIYNNFEWTRLSDVNEGVNFKRGTIFRFRGRYPYEDIVDFMLIAPQPEDQRMGIVVTTGYSAGSIVVYPPAESRPGNLESMKASWLKQNWTNWIKADSRREEVMVLDGQLSPVDIF